MRRRLALLNWRDLSHPKAGGAEIYTHNLMSGLAARGHEVTWFTSRASNADAREERDGYSIIRMGSELTCRFYAAAWLQRNLHRFDYVVDEVNTLPWLSPIIAKGRVRLLIFQLAREVWFAEAPQPISTIGYLSEPALLQIYRNVPAITISESSARSLREIGLKGPIDIVECPLLGPVAPVRMNPTPGLIGFVGRLARSKRTEHVIAALAWVRREFRSARLLIIGGGPDRERHRLGRLAFRLGVGDAVEFTGRVSDEDRDLLLSRVDVLAIASLREGWGLVVSEAARFGIPAVGYPVSGLVDSIRHGYTGLITERCEAPQLAQGILRIIADRELRNRLGLGAADYIRRFTFDRFIEGIEASLFARD